MDPGVIPATEGVSHIGQRQRISTIYRTNEIIRRIQGEGESAEVNAENMKKVVRLSSLYNCGVGGVPKYKIKRMPSLPNYQYTSEDWRSFREKLFNSFYFRENGVTDVSSTSSSIVSFETLRGILSTAYRTTFTTHEVYALGYELDVIKKIQGDVVIDFNSLLVKLKRLAAMVRDATTSTNLASPNTAITAPAAMAPIHPPALHAALSAISTATIALWKTEFKYMSEMLSLNAIEAINCTEMRDFLLYNLGIKLELNDTAMIIAYCNGQNQIPLSPSPDNTIPLSFLLKCLKLTAIGRKNWLSPPDEEDFLPWSLFVLQNKTNLITTKETITITSAIENTNVSAAAAKKLKMLQPTPILTSTSTKKKKKHVTINHSTSADSIAPSSVVSSESRYSTNKPQLGNSNYSKKSSPLLPTILGSHTSSMKGVGSAIRRAKTPVLLARPSSIADNTLSKQTSAYDIKATQLRYEFRWKMLAILLSQFYATRVTLDDVVTALLKGVQEKYGVNIVTHNRGILVDRQVFLNALGTLFPESGTDFIQKLFSSLDPLRNGSITLHGFHTSVTISVLKSISTKALLQGASIELEHAIGMEGFSEMMVIDALSAVSCSPEATAIITEAAHNMFRYYFHQRLSSKSYLHPSVSLADNTLLTLAEVESYVQQNNLLPLLQEQHRQAYEQIHSKLELNKRRGSRVG